MRLELIVFDWDGTLMDSEARIVACIQTAFAELGEEPPSRAAARNIIGLGLEEAMAMLWPDAGIERRRLVMDRYRAHFLGGNETPSTLFPGVADVLTALGDDGYLLGVATGKSRRGLDEALKTTALQGHFHATRCADETRSKPHPDMLVQIMDELGVSAGSTLMVGDTEYDMQMAHNAGVHALAVSYGVHERARLLEQNPLACLASLGELRGWLERFAQRRSAPF